MQQSLGYLFAAFAGTWIAIFGYIFYIQHRLNETRRHLHWLEEDAASRHHTP